MYLVRYFDNHDRIVKCETFEEVKKWLLLACTAWVISDNYCSDGKLDTPQKLFDYAMKKKDFGDIAQVFQIDSYFLLGEKEKNFCDFSECDLRTPFSCQRIL